MLQLKKLNSHNAKCANIKSVFSTGQGMSGCPPTPGQPPVPSHKKNVGVQFLRRVGSDHGLFFQGLRIPAYVAHGASYGRGRPGPRDTALVIPASPPSATVWAGCVPPQALTHNSGSFCCLDTSEDMTTGN